MGTRTVAIDVGASTVRVAEVELGSGPDGRDGATLHAYAEAPVPAGIIRDGVAQEPTALSQIIQGALSSVKTSTKNVTVGIGLSSIVVREVDIPAQPMDKVRQSLAFHVQDQLPMPADEAILDFYPTMEIEASAGMTLRGLLVASPREVVRDALSIVEKGGAHVTAVDHSAFGLWRSGCRGPLMQTNVAFVDIGADTTTVVISQAGMPRLIRALPQGGNDATKGVANIVKGSALDAEALKREVGMDMSVGPDRRAIAEASAHVMSSLVEAVRNTMVYFASSNPGGGAERIVLSGGGAHMRGLGQALASATRLPVVIAEPLAGLRLGKKADLRAIQGREFELATVVGLAMRSAK
ncbi:type IV pilus assembly protein PilM [Demequina sp. SYSU T00068]|uniref:type IV pilus assembly protein PilM n=1 Tax=Demequina lignilytica TaxID=3051663 RepID=UPI0026138B8D|nr:type IV pilus assembly protein PilM [Demequina sp. SYSU T00068]MDN4489392.1 type IV pilus assembly protein PilM [Demequina sp. SYSU T00068]